MGSPIQVKLITNYILGKRYQRLDSLTFLDLGMCQLSGIWSGVPPVPFLVYMFVLHLLRHSLRKDFCQWCEWQRPGISSVSVWDQHRWGQGCRKSCCDGDSKWSRWRWADLPSVSFSVSPLSILVCCTLGYFPPGQTNFCVQATTEHFKHL